MAISNRLKLKVRVIAPSRRMQNLFLKFDEAPKVAVASSIAAPENLTPPIQTPNTECQERTQSLVWP